MRRAESYLIVDDELDYCQRLAEALAEHGITDVRWAQNYDQAMAAAVDLAPTRAIVDMRLGNDTLDGFNVVRDFHARYPSMRIVMITNYPSLQAMRTAVALGAVDLVPKSEDIPQLLHAFARVDRQRVDASSIPLTPLTLRENEWEYINRVLSWVDGNISMAAEVLGIGRSTLYRKLEQMPIERLSKAGHRVLEVLDSKRAQHKPVGTPPAPRRRPRKRTRSKP